MKRGDFEAMIEGALQALSDEIVVQATAKPTKQRSSLKVLRYGEAEQRIGKTVSVLAGRYGSDKSLPMITPEMVPPCF